MVADLKPRFLRFPGGTFVEGDSLRNAYRWKETVGPWEERPGHYNDIWNYWTDDGFGYFEGLQLAEDLNALPIWVFNAGISRHEEVNSTELSPYVQDALDSIEFARGSNATKWENYGIIYNKIRSVYPDVRIISNCDGSEGPINQPADLFEYHLYSNSKDMFSKSSRFDNTSRSGPKGFVSEYAVWKEDAGMGTLIAAVSEAAFLIGLEKNSDIVEMACYAPLFLNINDKKWLPDAIVFDSYQHYGTPSYWMQKFFIESNGAIFLPSTLQTNSSNSVIASAINFKGSKANENYIRIKVVNFGVATENLHISVTGLNSTVKQLGSTKTVLTSSNTMDENSFSEPNKIVPHQSPLENAAQKMNVTLPPYSVTSFDLLI
ncbi:putative glycosidase [Lupinus albus]|uniref:non-reducing end alpha-L-arabinofuranosidase n=1 Tax=Lupinus albus TaxID=3870 RepID=A0A6A4NQ45_LUPAL|nr:putative glycosidase [Lupinus albus]